MSSQPFLLRMLPPTSEYGIPFNNLYKAGECWATYEPAQVRKFLHGRTACVRSLSVAAKEWVLAMESQSDRRPTAHRLELLREAANSHIEYARHAAEVH